MRKIWNGLSLETLRHFSDSYDKAYNLHMEQANNNKEMRDMISEVILERTSDISTLNDNNQPSKNSDHIITGPMK